MIKFTILAIICLFAHGLNAQTILVYTEHFKTYDNVWKQFDNDTGMLSVTDSKYKISCRGENTPPIYTVESKKINPEKDFSIETAIIHTSGNQNQYYGISYGYQDDSNNYTFCITAEGNYQICKNENAKPVELISGTASQFVKKGNSEYNTLKIEKTSSNFLFYVNDSLLAQLPAASLKGNDIGFVVTGTQSVEVDYLNIYVDLSNPVKGIEIPANMVNTLNEDFNDNSNSWIKANCSSGMYKIEQGKATLKSSAIGRCCNIYLWSEINQQNDFIIEAEVRKTDGSDNSSFGILSGSEGLSSSFQWLLQSNGEFGYYTDYSGGTDYASEINAYNAPNKLSVYKNNNLVIFYINGKEVFSSTYQPAMFDVVGFVVCDPVTIEIENLKIWEVKP